MRISAHVDFKIMQLSAALKGYDPIFWNYKDGILALKTKYKVYGNIDGCELISSHPHDEGFITKFKI